MRKMILVLMLLLFPAVGWADEYVLVMSKEDNVCQQMLKLYNADLKKYGEVKYDTHKEFNWIKWEEKEIRIRRIGGLSQEPVDVTNARFAVFDVNNDSKGNVIVYRESMLSGNPIEVYDILRDDILAILNENAIIGGEIYFSKRLKSFDSATGIPVNIYDFSEESIKKLPNRAKKHIEVTKKRGDKDNFFVGRNDRINFLKIKNRFYINLEGPRDIGPDEDWSNVEQYSLIAALQKDNTLKNLCLYLIDKTKLTQRRK